MLAGELLLRIQLALLSATPGGFRGVACYVVAVRPASWVEAGWPLPERVGLSMYLRFSGSCSAGFYLRQHRDRLVAASASWWHWSGCVGIGNQ